MAVVCPNNNTGQFSKPSRIRSYTPRRRKDYTKPLHVDCSVEYELPNSAKPPAGNKSEPLLMIHPSYYRREESKHRSHFINNLPKRRSSSRNCRSSTIRNTGSQNYGVSCVSARSHNKRALVSMDQLPSKQSIPSAALHKAANVITESCFQPSRHCEVHPQPTVLHCEGTTSNVPEMDLISFWKRTVESGQNTTSLGFGDMQTHNEKSLPTMISVHELATVPVPDNSTARNIDTWLSSYHDGNATANNKNGNKNNHNVKYSVYNTRSKKNYSVNVGLAMPSKATSTGKVASQNSMSLSGIVLDPSSTISCMKQQQPAVGVAAIAPPFNCNDCCSSMRPVIEGALLRPQPWSATTASEFPPSSLPISAGYQDHSLILPLELPTTNSPVYKSTSGARKRAADNETSWWCDGINDDSTLPKRTKSFMDENTGYENSQWFAKSVANFNQSSDYCETYYPQEGSCYNYSSSCAMSSNPPCSNMAWNRPNTQEVEKGGLKK